MSDYENVDRASQLEELRFAKKQQWYIATAAVTLLAAIFWIERNVQLDGLEKAAATVFLMLITGFGGWFLFKLQNYMKTVRLMIDPNDPNPWWRNGDVLFVLIGALFFAAVVVLYFLWTHVAGVETPDHLNQGTVVSRSDVEYYLTVVSAGLLTLTLLAYCIREFIWPLIRRLILRHPVKAWFVITSSDRFDLGYAIQDAEEHFTNLLVLPANTDDLLLHLYWEARLSFTQYHLEVSFEGNRKTKPLINYWFHPFVKVGIRIKKPGEEPGHYIDYHDNYHIDEIRHRAYHQGITYGFKITTRDPGRFQLKVGIAADGVDGTVFLPVYVEEKPKTNMRCRRHWCCTIKVRSAVSSLSQSAVPSAQ